MYRHRRDSRLHSIYCYSLAGALSLFAASFRDYNSTHTLIDAAASLDWAKMTAFVMALSAAGTVAIRLSDRLMLWYYTYRTGQAQLPPVDDPAKPDKPAA